MYIIFTFLPPLESICFETLTIFIGIVNLLREGTLHLYLLLQFLGRCCHVSEEFYEFARAAVTKCHRLGGLNNRN